MKTVKLPFIRMDQDSDPTALQVGAYTEMRNLLPANVGISTGTARESVPGTTDVGFDGALTGTSSVIGRYEDTEGSQAIFFVYNSNSEHSIVRLTDAGTYTVILKSSVLNFTLTGYISGVDVNEGVLYWTDNNNPERQLNIDRAIAGDYTPTAEELAFLKPLPANTTATLGTDATIGNNISADGWQFMVQYVFNDNELSALGPFSGLVPPKIYPEIDENADNKATLSHTIDENIYLEVKTVRWIYRKNNTEDYYIFAEEKDITTEGPHTTVFTNKHVSNRLPDSDTLFFNNIARKSKTFSLFKGRSFHTYNTHEYDDDSSFALTAANINATYTGTSKTIEAVHKQFGEYQYATVFYDAFGRTNGAQNTVEHEVTDYTPQGVTDVRRATDLLSNVRLTLTGTPPTWATHYSFARKRTDVQEFVVTIASAMFYKADWDGSAGLGANEIRDGTKIFEDDHQSSWNDPIYFKIPENLPFSVSTGHYVRMLTDISAANTVEPVLAVHSDRIVVGNFGVTDWTTFNGKVLIEIYKPKLIQDEFFEEVSGRYSIAGDGFNGETFDMEGDCWLVADTGTSQSLGWGFNAVDDLGAGLQPGYTIYGDTSQRYFGAYYISESPTKKGTVLRDSLTEQEQRSDEEKLEIARERNPSLFVGFDLEQKISSKVNISPFAKILFGGLPGIIHIIRSRKRKRAIEAVEAKDIIKSTIIEAFTLDYNKKVNDKAVPMTEVPNIQEKSMPNIIGFSDKYVLETNINGLSSYSAFNTYPIPTERTPITVLQEANNVLLAIHERNVTSLYVEEGFVRQGEGDLLAQTEGVLTTSGDRLLKGGYGTVHPLSVTEHGGKVYFFDAHKGELVRYNNNGLTPLGEKYNMRSYLKAKGAAYLTTGNIITGYDPYLDIVYLTFKGGPSDETLAFLDKDTEEGFLGFFDFVPDAYIKLNNTLYSFLEKTSGGFQSKLMWSHNTDTVNYNRFYDVDYASKVIVPVNVDNSLEKMWRALGVNSTTVWEMETLSNEFGQDSELLTGDFTKKDGTWFADFLRDKNTDVNVLTGIQTALAWGDPISSKELSMEFTNSSTSKEVIKYIGVGYLEKEGHFVI